MKSLTDYLWFTTQSRRDLINITDALAERVTRSGIHARWYRF